MWDDFYQTDMYFQTLHTLNIVDILLIVFETIVHTLKCLVCFTDHLFYVKNVNKINVVLQVWQKLNIAKDPWQLSQDHIKTFNTWTPYNHYMHQILLI